MKIIKKILGVLGVIAVVMAIIGLIKKAGTIYKNKPNEQNPMEGKRVRFVEDENEDENADGVRGHLEAIGDSEHKESFYEKYIKRGIDIVLSFGGLVLLSPLFLFISLWIIIDDPGPVLFTQKRIGKDKKYFKLHKFRSMKMSTPHDKPTHMLDNPDQYITKAGKFIRAHSLDELPQIWDIFIGNMSVIGPRPGLWNQDLLTAERDKWGANDIKPGLTGWAQINGRDELEIPVKAKLDGEYTDKLGLMMDIKCFLGSIGVFKGDKSVVEGGTGEISKIGRSYTDNKSDGELIGNIGFGEKVDINYDNKVKVLITGANSYIGDSFYEYAKEKYDNIKIDIIDTIDGTWKEKDFSAYDIVYHVAGIAHADVGNVSNEVKEKYYAVNTDLAVEVAKKAKEEGVKRFIFMSSMIVYGDSAPYGKERVIDSNTVPKPSNFYGDSKLQADVAVRSLADKSFNVIVLRPPMIYGKGSKGNYPLLAKLAKKIPVFPKVDNDRSMLYIGNLCEFLCKLMMIKSINNASTVLLPQNNEWTNTGKMVKLISEAYNKRIVLIGGLFKIAVSTCGKVPGKIGGLVNKAFGNNCYKHDMSIYDGLEYQIYSLVESVKLTESKKKQSNKKKILVVSQYFYPESFRINDMCLEWIKRGYEVTVITGIPNYPKGKIYEGYGLTKKRKELWNGIEIIRIPLIPRGSNSIGLVLNYISFAISGYLSPLFNKIRADYVFSFEVSPMTQVITGIRFAKKLKVPHYLYVQDLWPENVVTVTGINNPIIINPIDKMVDYIYKNSDEIFTTSPSFVDAICNRKKGVDRDKVHYWPQYAEEFYVPVEKKELKEIPDDESFKVIFTGNVGTAQGLQILPEAAGFLKDEEVTFVIVGDGRYLENLKKEVTELGVSSKFVFVPRIPAELIPDYLAVCDVAFLSFQNDDLWAKTIPAKLQSYMACGMPIVASAMGETQRIIEEADCGICSKIGDSKDLANSIIKLKSVDLKNKGINSRKYFEKNFDKKLLMDQMDEYF